MIIMVTYKIALHSGSKAKSTHHSIKEARVEFERIHTKNKQSELKIFQLMDGEWEKVSPFVIHRK